MKLCRFCIENILESGRSWDYHHQSYSALEASRRWDAVNQPVRLSREKKKEQCLFCSTLHTDIDKFARQLKEPRYAAAWPVCRWSIRSLARIRESLETVVVTFRYVPPVSDAELLGFKEIELPTRMFCFFPEEHLQPLPTLSQLGSSTNPADNGGHQIRSWLQHCDSSHGNCLKRRKATISSKHFVPTRLLDLSGPPGKPIRLIETETKSVQSPYCSLSHCWGSIKFQELHDTNREEFMREGVPWNQLPKNFQEAIEIARALEIWYIWIDSLCIIQNSRSDWKYEASRMHLVYRNSYCNIAVADATDSQGGAFRKRNPEDIIPVRYQPTKDSSFFKTQAWAVVPEDLWDRELLHASLYTRGWVFQERMLAPRILHFARRQVFWECPSLSACETLPGGLPQPIDSVAGPDRHWRARLQEPEDSKEPLVGATDQSLQVFWKMAVQEYTSCRLTNGGDKLIAMWGIAKLVRDALGIEYGNGLWEKNLEDHLAWRVAECQEIGARNLVSSIPTWSWASMNATIVVPDRLTDENHYKVTDHHGQPLRFNLQGAKQIVRARMPARGQTDTDAESLRHTIHAKEKPLSLVGRNSFPRNMGPTSVDRDDLPVFDSISIQIQGHVGQGRLEYDTVQKTWTLRIGGTAEVDIEAFPDTMPSNEVEWARNRYFVVLAAKQVFRPLITEGADRTLKWQIESRGLGIIEEEEEDQDDHGYDYAGHGILMRYAGDHHFRRTGAFRFRNASKQAFGKLQETEEWKALPDEMYHPNRGRKFWLD